MAAVLAFVVGTNWTKRTPLFTGTFNVSAATLEVSDASKLGQEITTTPLKNVPSALKSVSLTVVRGGVAPSFELSARLHRTKTHSRHNRKRNIRPPGKPRNPAPAYSRLRRSRGLTRVLGRANFQRGKDFGWEEISGSFVTRPAGIPHRHKAAGLRAPARCHRLADSFRR